MAMLDVIGGPEEGLVSWVDDPDLRAEALRVSIEEDLHEAVMAAVAVGWAPAEIREVVDRALIG
jgi:hypothetical protein